MFPLVIIMRMMHELQMHATGTILTQLKKSDKNQITDVAVPLTKVIDLVLMKAFL